MRLLQPDYTASSVHEVCYGELWSAGVRGVVFDLDNTLCGWREDGLGEEAEGLLRKLHRNGFKVAILSNGRLSRRKNLLEKLSRLKVPVVWPGRKPWPWGFRRALSAMGLQPHEAAMVGDQTFTDVLGARVVGLRAVLVRPISAREHPATTPLRWLERLIVRP